MRKQIEQIMNRVESGNLAYHDAVEELLLLYNVVGRSEQLKAFLTWLEKEGGSPFIDKDAMIDDWLKSL